MPPRWSKSDGENSARAGQSQVPERVHLATLTDSQRETLQETCGWQMTETTEKTEAGSYTDQ